MGRINLFINQTARSAASKLSSDENILIQGATAYQEALKKAGYKDNNNNNK